MINTIEQRPTFVSHLECGLHGDRYPADQLHGLSKAGKPLLVRYDLPSLAQAIGKDDLRERPTDLWRYREFLPVRHSQNIVSLGETMTPLIPVSRFQGGNGRLLVKDEGRLPTGSFKGRGICLAISMAKELGVTRIAMPTNGNAGAALAAQEQAATKEGVLLCPEGAATLAAYQQELGSGRISSDESVVLFNCATGLKYPMPPVTRALDCKRKIDYHELS